ncbi:MAG: hypothetical protein K2L86_12840 [Lachnospiraceae bacterium]|nr:hypothetical protein [Lachnospiraceae bacterium]
MCADKQKSLSQNDLLQNVLFCGIFVAFFACLLLTGEPVYTGDTFQHENQMIMREPGYALLIQFLRFLSPDRHYWILIALQNLLAAAANTAVMVFMRRRFQLNLFVSFLFTGILLVPHIMTPLFSSTHLVLTNALMTEGILFSIYPVAFIQLLRAMWSGRPMGRESARALLLLFFISLIRGQMMVLFVVWFLVMFVMAVIRGVQATEETGDRKNTFVLAENIGRQGLYAILAAFVIAFAARSLVIHVYNYCEQGLFVDTASGTAMSFANILYVADREDGEAIENDALRALFYEMYDRADADQMNYKYAPSGILGRALHHEQCHDDLNFIYFAEPAKQYVGETQNIYSDRYQELMIAIDEVAGGLSAQLMPQVLGRYILNYFSVTALGFVRTVAYENPVLVRYAVFIYAAAIALTLLLWQRAPKSMAASFMAVVLLTIAGNVCATALMIQCISRYMIYNLPLFYMAGFLELRELFIMKKQGGKAL